MQLKRFSIINAGISFQKVLFFILFFLSISLLFSPILHAQSNQPPSPDTVEAAFKNCPESIKTFYLGQVTVDKNGNYYKFNPNNPDDKQPLNGTFIASKTPDGKLMIECPDPANAIDKLILRVVMVLISIVGIVFVFAVAKSAFLIILSNGDTEKFQEAVKGLVTSIVSIIALFMSYFVIVFILVGILGVGTERTEGSWRYSLVCQNQLFFSVVLDKTSPACSTTSQSSGTGSQ